MKHDERTGLLFAIAGFSLLSCGDAVVKTMTGEWSPLAVAALRFTIGAVGLAALLGVREGTQAFRPRSWRLQIARGVCLGISTLFFFSAVFLMPLAEATALVFLAPIFVGLLSGPLLGEKVTRATWTASIFAFAGVLIILRPNVAELGWAAFLPVAAAVFFALMVIANRASAGQGSALSMQALLACVAAPVLVLAAATGHLTGAPFLAVSTPDWTIVARCAVVALTASTAHWLIYLGTTRAGASTIAPTSYVQLLVVGAIGWLFFDEFPDAATWLGAAIIVAAGLYLWRQGAAAKSDVAIDRSA